VSGILYVLGGTAIVWLFFRGSLNDAIGMVNTAAAGKTAPRTDPSLGGSH